MIPEFGHFALILALCLSVLTSVLGLAGAHLNRPAWMAATASTVVGQFVFVALAFVVLAHAFVTDDFSVAYVAHNSNSLLPWPYKVSAVWGAHEGSFLLWTLIMTVWMSAVALKGAALPLRFLARVLGVMGLLNLGFLSFLIFTSNPFDRLVPLVPMDGSDLNPLLQDFGLIVHPPMLYAGYVGFAVAFAFAVAALLSGRLDSAWARWSRPWTNIAWAFLTVGIALGSWWAYYELGWGGWWFWDPVENASFMPWLVGTALVHSLAVTEKRGTFKSWTLLLAISAFSLSLLGAFIVRSGVLTSVHAFAVDPARGMFILAFLAVVVGGSLVLYGLRASAVAANVRFSLFSRETFLLLNNLLLVVALGIVLLGTLYPLAYEAISGGDKISIGPPWFNQFFVPLMLVVAFALGIGPWMSWKRTNMRELVRRLRWVLVASVVIGVVLPLILSGELQLTIVMALSLALWIVGTHLLDFVRRARLGLGRVPVAYCGMALAHVGFAVTVLGIALTHELSIEEDMRMAPGEEVVHGDVAFLFNGVVTTNGPNYTAESGRFEIRDGDRQFLLIPEKRRYLAGGSVMTEAAIDAGFFKDIYVSLGEPLANGDWAVRIYIKPFVRWIWFGCLMMAFGGALAVADKRYRRLQARSARRLAEAGA
ncbi:MAG: heme lyase CcmF/NrfE family subunit [Gammaproteobacteria bacterium]|nr:heme lyase CcmF/NrfE family subunit [Gammaproteobacteria bacterium]